MKFIKYFPLFLLFSFLTNATYAQKKVVEDTIQVEGICGMCKTRIEEAAFGSGVKFVEWTNSTSELVIAYRSNKTSLEEIEARIAKAGHTTSHVDTKEEDYNTLPDCCRYETGQKH